MQDIVAQLTTIWNGAINYGVPFVITLSIVVFVHEYGHYWVARRCGVKIVSFSIGMGPEIFGRTDKKGTRWKFSLLPIGGYVQMFGDADPSSATVSDDAKALSAEERSVAFFAQNVWKRLAIIAAGPGSNYLFAFVVLLGMFTIFGKPVQLPIFDSVTQGSAAEQAGLLPGDKVISVDGDKITSFYELLNKTELNLGTPMTLVVERKGELKTIAVTPRIIETTDRLGNHVKKPRIGVTSMPKTERYESISPLQAVGETFAYIGGFTRDTITVISQMIMGTRSTEDLGGALRIAKISGEIAQTRDIGWFVEFLVKISLSLGFINLMPVPLLDGGHIFFYLIEAVRRRPLPERFQEYAARLGLGLVLSLMAFTLWNDMIFLKWIPK